MDDCTGFQRFDYYKARGREGTGVCTDRLQFENATTEERRREKKASTRQAAKRRGSEGAAIKHCPRDSEPECLLDK